MKMFLAKYHERATLPKLWRQTGNSSLLPPKCWPLLRVIAGISARFSNFAFVLFCYITNHLMTGPLGNSEFCFPRISVFPSTSSRETLRFLANKIHCYPRDQSLSVKCNACFTKLLSWVKQGVVWGVIRQGECNVWVFLVSLKTYFVLSFLKWSV